MVAVVCASAPSRADVVLEQSAGACSLDGVRAALTTLPAIAADAHVQIATRLADDRVEASLTLDGGDARELHARDCGELAKSIALVIVMTLRERPAAPARDVRVVPLEPATVAAPDARIAPVPAPARPPVAAGPAIEAPLAARAAIAPSRAPLELLAIAGGLTDHHAHPAAVLGGRIGRGRVALGLELELARGETIDVGDGGALHVSRTLASVTPCATVQGISLCGLATAGLVRARSERLANGTAVARGTFEVGVRAEWITPLVDRLGLRFHADALQAIGSAGFLVDQMPVWSTDPRELRLGIGLVAIFL